MLASVCKAVRGILLSPAEPRPKTCHNFYLQKGVILPKNVFLFTFIVIFYIFMMLIIFLDHCNPTYYLIGDFGMLDVMCWTCVLPQEVKGGVWAGDSRKDRGEGGDGLHVQQFIWSAPGNSVWFCERCKTLRALSMCEVILLMHWQCADETLTPPYRSMALHKRTSWRNMESWRLHLRHVRIKFIYCY